MFRLCGFTYHGQHIWHNIVSTGKGSIRKIDFTGQGLQNRGGASQGGGACFWVEDRGPWLVGFRGTVACSFCNPSPEASKWSVLGLSKPCKTIVFIVILRFARSFLSSAGASWDCQNHAKPLCLLTF